MGEVIERSPLWRTIRIALLALAALLLLVPAAVPAALPGRIVAVGDLHGDYDAWVQIARAAGLTDQAGHWAAGKATLVQLGDILDREPDSLKIVRSLQELQKEASRAGGHVVVVLGNHEAMNLLGDFRYTTPGEFSAFAGPGSAALRDRIYEQNRSAIEKAAQATNPALTSQQIRNGWMAEHPLGWLEHKFAWSPSGDLGRWAARNPAIVRIGNTLFVHGGLSAEYSKLTLEEINHRVAAAMTTGDGRPTTVLYDPLGPLWYRGLVMKDADAEDLRSKASPPPAPMEPGEELRAVLSAYGAQRLVIGHTPDLKGIEISADGRLARIDTGISRAYGGPLSWLEIIGGSMIPHTVVRSAQ
ncbi:MAG TPA: metallophosphoesterase [Sphingomicrobium sp.]|nr:metallophosphoesterase [Sphingomicrobium sp.]